MGFQESFMDEIIGIDLASQSTGDLQPDEQVQVIAVEFRQLTQSVNVSRSGQAEQPHWICRYAIHQTALYSPRRGKDADRAAERAVYFGPEMFYLAPERMTARHAPASESHATGSPRLLESFAHQLRQIFHRQRTVIQHGFMVAAELELVAQLSLDLLAETIERHAANKIC